MTTQNSPSIMVWVLVALAPGALLQCYWFGPVGTLGNLGLALVFGLATETLLIYLRAGPDWSSLRDYSGLVTVVLIALALPPATPWQVIAIACVGALALGKHAYGGTGRNVFNPAMVGYAIVLVSFPALFVWPPTDGIDGVTGPTLLESFKHRGALTVDEVWHSGAEFGAFGGAGMEWLNLAYLGGGIVLLQRRIVDWRMPTAMLASMGAIALLGYQGAGSDSIGSPLMHWFSGATMLGAWFVATDPVTCPASPRGRLLFGALVGGLTMAIRIWGGYPDGIAFAVLLANAAAPTIDRYLSVRRPVPGITP